MKITEFTFICFKKQKPMSLYFFAVLINEVLSSSQIGDIFFFAREIQSHFTLLCCRLCHHHLLVSSRSGCKPQTV